MRVWEFDDNRVIPSDLVLEQDFILRLRRLQRSGLPHLVVNLVLSVLEHVAKSRRALTAMQDKLKEFARVTNGAYAELSNGDVFIIWEETSDAAILSSRILAAVMPPEADADLADKLLLSYHMPQDYVPLRERANYYVEIVRAVAVNTTVVATPTDALHSRAAQGPLTAWSVDQIGKLLTEIDLKRYGRTQPIYRRGADGTLTPIAEEYFIGFDDLKREQFPKLEVITPEHLFLALCELMDQKFLAMLTEHYDTIAGRALWFNLSVASVLGSVFAQFTRRVPMDKHGLIGFEIHRGDLLQDFALTLNAIDVLHKEGFRVALDAITPDMLGYIDFAAFQNVDMIKINVSRERIHAFDNPDVLRHLAVLPRDKIVFIRCDSEKALTLGIAQGITHFQGWFIDDMVNPKDKEKK